MLGRRRGLVTKYFMQYRLLLYAVLTQRVLLLPTFSHLPDVMCEPFEGSSWSVNTDVEDIAGLFKSVSEVLGGLDSEKAGSAASERFYASKVDYWWQPVSRYWRHTFSSRIHVRLLSNVTDQASLAGETKDRLDLIRLSSIAVEFEIWSWSSAHILVNIFVGSLNLQRNSDTQGFLVALGVMR